MNNMGDRPMLLVNEAANQHHWLALHLVGTRSNRSAIGARILVHGGRRIWVDEVRSGSSYSSSSDLRVHFGLGEDAGPVKVEIRWPSGLQEQFGNVLTDRIVDLQEGSGTAAAVKPAS